MYELSHLLTLDQRPAHKFTVSNSERLKLTLFLFEQTLVLKRAAKAPTRGEALQNLYG